MNNSINTPDLNDAVEQAIAQLSALPKTGDAGKDRAALLSSYRAMMFNEEFVDKKQRQAFHKKVNDGLGIGYTMNQVRKAASLDQPREKLIEVDELHGTVNVQLGQSTHIVDNLSIDHPTQHPLLTLQGHLAKMEPEATQAQNEKELLDSKTPVTGIPDPDAAAALLVADAATSKTPLEHPWVDQVYLNKLHLDFPELLSGEKRTTSIGAWFNTLDKSIQDQVEAFSEIPGTENLSLEDLVLQYLINTDELKASFRKHLTGLTEVREFIKDPLTTVPVPPSAPMATVQQVTDPVDPIVTPASLKTPNTSKPQTTRTEKDSTMTTPKTAPFAQAAFDEFLAKLKLAGYKTAEERSSLYTVFLKENVHFQAKHQETGTLHGGMTEDGTFFAFLAKNEDAMAAFGTFLLSRAQLEKEVVAQASDRGRFDLRGKRDDGVNGAWMGVGGAVVGAVLEVGHSGSLTVGSAIGAVAGIAGAFFAGEYIDNKVDGAFSRQVAAGTLGMAIGALGSGLGRIAQGHVPAAAELPQVTFRTAEVPVPVVGDLSAFALR